MSEYLLPLQKRTRNKLRAKKLHIMRSVNDYEPNIQLVS